MVNISISKQRLWSPEPYPDADHSMAKTYLALRRFIGLLAIALPVVLVLGWMVLNGGRWPDSISAYYYSHLRDYFVGSLWAIGVFLAFYRYAPRDNTLSTVLGVLAVAVSLFPTDQSGATSAEKVIGVIHDCCASAFLVGLAVFSLFVFTRTAGDPDKLLVRKHSSACTTPEKDRRNRVYQACGVAILVFLALAVIAGLTFSDSETHRLHPLFWMESCSVWAFAVSWLVKGEWLKLADKRPCPPSPTKRRSP
jgi:hypothetical protein